MNIKFIPLLLLILLNNPIAHGQELNTTQLDKLFNSLQKRNEAMGSIAISKNGVLLYNRAFGYRSIEKDTLVLADSRTEYRIWSTTKLYTATMMMQMVDQGDVSLETTLDTFYPQIPNSSEITVEQMLRHTSGIHDFTQNNSQEDWDVDINTSLTREFMVNLISSYEPDFKPGQKMQYSNSNYLLLGFIVERLDSGLYEHSLSRRISSKIGLTDTYFSSQDLDTLTNKAYSYRFRAGWNSVDEGSYSGLVPGGAGGILSTTSDMTKFIDALFVGKLISTNSLEKMLEGDDFYRAGVMKTYIGEKPAYGHTGGNKASESSLFYFPNESLAIAYCTNGAVMSKEEVLQYILAIYDQQPFAISINRKRLGLVILILSIISIVAIYYTSRSALNTDKLLWLGFPVFIIFWMGVIVSGLLLGEYSQVKENLINLTSFYSISGDIMSGVQFTVAILSVIVAVGIIKICREAKLSVLPVLSLLFWVVSMLGTALFPMPHAMTPLFANIIILSISGPVLAIFFWCRLKGIKWMSIVCLALMAISTGLLISRSSFPVFVGEYFGLIQRAFFLGITCWLAYLSYYFSKSISLR